jgi:hypothetical protein
MSLVPGFGLDSILHAVPSHTSTSVCDSPNVKTLLDWYDPTAVHEVADVHDTPLN